MSKIKGLIGTLTEKQLKMALEYDGPEIIGLDYVPWTHLHGTRVWTAAKQMMEFDQGRTYHNIDHVIRMYHHAQALKIPYDKTLDMAILFHDVIYDGKPDAEKRSARLLVDLFPDQIDAAFMILETIHHHPKTGKELVLLDLYDFTDPKQRLINLDLLTVEAKNLFDADPDQFYYACSNILQEITLRISLEASKTDYQHQWRDIRIGIDQVLFEMNQRDSSQQVAIER